MRTFRVYWERAERIAFNMGGEIFLNTAYARSLLEPAGGGAPHADEKAAELDFWFVTIPGAKRMAAVQRPRQMHGRPMPTAGRGAQALR